MSTRSRIDRPHYIKRMENSLKRRHSSRRHQQTLTTFHVKTNEGAICRVEQDGKFSSKRQHFLSRYLQTTIASHVERKEPSHIKSYHFPSGYFQKMTAFHVKGKEPSHVKSYHIPSGYFQIMTASHVKRKEPYLLKRHHFPIGYFQTMTASHVRRKEASIYRVDICRHKCYWYNVNQEYLPQNQVISEPPPDVFGERGLNLSNNG